REVQVDEIYLGKVKRIEKFGAFVELYKGKDGLLHISEIQEERTNKVEDVLSIGDEIMVKVKEVDRQGRVNLTRKELLKEEKEKNKYMKEAACQFLFYFYINSICLSYFTLRGAIG